MQNIQPKTSGLDADFVEKTQDTKKNKASSLSS